MQQLLPELYNDKKPKWERGAKLKCGRPQVVDTCGLLPKPSKSVV